jgi:Cys-rich repeat protein
MGTTGKVSSLGGTTTAATEKKFIVEVMTYNNSVECFSYYCPSSWSHSCAGICSDSTISGSFWPACGRAYCTADSDCKSGFVCISGALVKYEVGENAPAGANYCLPPKCTECGGGVCYWDGTRCSFAYCVINGQVTDRGAGGSSGGGSTNTGGHTSTTVVKPPVNCSSYSFPGCSLTGSTGFATSCQLAGCSFSLGSCVSHGGTSDSTCDCLCY